MPKKILVEFNGKIACLTEHCKDMDIPTYVIFNRHKRTGESYKECLEYYQENGIKYRNRDYKVKDKRLYCKWYNIKRKCENPNHAGYKWYGERGIKVCERWQLYENFENDLLESFLEHVEKYGIKDTQIERIDYNGSYEPNNVTWATAKEQQNNKSSNLMVTEDLNAKQFAEKYNLNYKLVQNRVNAGWSVEDIINIPANKHNKQNITYILPCGVGLRKHCKQNNYCYEAIINLIRMYNFTADKALAKYLEDISNRYYLPCNNHTKTLREHCKQNSYCYESVLYYIKKYNLEPDEALVRYLKNRYVK